MTFISLFVCFMLKNAGFDIRFDLDSQDSSMTSWVWIPQPRPQDQFMIPILSELEFELALLSVL